MEDLKRELQQLVISDYHRRRDIIVLGSSRSFLMRKRFIPGDKDLFDTIHGHESVARKFMDECQ